MAETEDLKFCVLSRRDLNKSFSETSFWNACTMAIIN